MASPFSYRSPRKVKVMHRVMFIYFVKRKKLNGNKIMLHMARLLNYNDNTNNDDVDDDVIDEISHEFVSKVNINSKTRIQKIASINW